MGFLRVKEGNPPVLLVPVWGEAMSFDPSHPKDSRLAAFLRRRFPERMIFIRTGGASRTLNLSTSRQVLITAVVAGALGWTAYASTMQIAHEAILSLKTDQVEAARTAHDEILAEVVSYREKIAALTGDLQNSYSRANALAMRGIELQKEMVAVERRLGAPNRSEAAKQKDQAQYDALEAKYGQTETERHQIEAERARLRSQLAEIDGRMVRLAENGSVENDILDLRQAVLQRDLALNQRDSLLGENKRLADRLSRIQNAQKQMFEQVASLADGGIAQIEKTLKKTGLNVDELLGKQDVDAYAEEVVLSGLERRNGEFSRLRRDFDAAGVSVSDGDIQSRMSGLLRDVLTEMRNA